MNNEAWSSGWLQPSFTEPSRNRSVETDTLRGGAARRVVNRATCGDKPLCGLTFHVDDFDSTTEECRCHIRRTPLFHGAVLFFGAMVVSAEALACTLCHSPVAEEVRARLFESDFLAYGR